MAFASAVTKRANFVEGANGALKVSTSGSSFVDAFTKGKADAALAASVFHFGEIKLPQLKRILNEKNIPTRNIL